MVADARRILDAARRMGPAKFVVRNRYAVIERPGEIRDLVQDAQSLRADGSSFRLSLSAAHVASAFALEEQRAAGAKRSLQLFDAAGATIVKIVFRGESTVAPYRALSDELRHPSQSRQEPPSAGANRTAPEKSGEAANLAAFLERAAQLAVPLRFTVRNAAASLEAATPIRRVKRSERAPWINVLDPGIDLHLHEARIRAVIAEPGGGDSGWLHWLADDGSRAFSVEARHGFGELWTAGLVAATQ